MIKSWIDGEAWATSNSHKAIGYNYPAPGEPMKGSAAAQGGNNTFDWRDVRNFITFIGNSEEDNINLDSDKDSLWKTIFGSAFYAKLIEIYNLKKRTWPQIMEGVPAYAEDLFYRIQKSRKLANSSTWQIVQNIIIPNTSDLDIVKYVDTQVKYATHATYKYEIYAERIVFGSKY